MRTAYEEDELELEDSEPTSARELTLSSTTLLAIFFSLVLICGLFFGFGYTLGRRAPSEAAIEPTSVQAATSPISSQPKPSAAEQATSATLPAQASIPEDTPSPSDTTASDTPQTEPAPKVKPAVAAQPQPAPAVKSPQQVKSALTPAAQPVTPAAPSALQPAVPAVQIMVQIAAVSNSADADALVSALHKHGYTASVHRQAADTLNHVQIGPFATRAEALAMRQKLQADGYNAIMK